MAKHRRKHPPHKKRLYGFVLALLAVGGASLLWSSSTGSAGASGEPRFGLGPPAAGGGGDWHHLGAGVTADAQMAAQVATGPSAVDAETRAALVAVQLRTFANAVTLRNYLTWQQFEQRENDARWRDFQQFHQFLLAREEVVPARVPPADVWAALRHCESGGDYAEDTGNGYYGAYQFALGTWRSLGYPGYPNQAPPAVQDEAAVRLQARSGWGQWPACSARLGLR